MSEEEWKNLQRIIDRWGDEGSDTTGPGFFGTEQIIKALYSLHERVKKLECEQTEWNELTKPLIDAIRKSEEITAEDLQIIVR